ncbi:MAG: hypothetical protein K1060chlam5_00390 [Candidatus Anoxychlamydiales bacterium]|nr:hypothetical protein [Candidatus Anoxychlamydiales bacterium]
MAIDIVDVTQTKNKSDAISEYDLIKLFGKTFGREAMLMVTLGDIINFLASKVSDIDRYLAQLANGDSPLNFLTPVANKMIKSNSPAAKVIGGRLNSLINLPAHNMANNAAILASVTLSLGMISTPFNVVDEENALNKSAAGKLIKGLMSLGETVNLRVGSYASLVAAYYKLSYVRAQSTIVKLNGLVELYNKQSNLNKENIDSASETEKALMDSVKTDIQASYDAETKKLYFK